MQLVQHYGQRLFSQLWTERVRFMFEQQELPEFSNELPASEDSIDQWALSTLRFVQYQAFNTKDLSDSGSIPAYTRDGFERVQELRRTVAEAQFSSQFNGSRSIAQISKNLRLDISLSASPSSDFSPWRSWNAGRGSGRSRNRAAGCAASSVVRENACGRGRALVVRPDGARPDLNAARSAHERSRTSTGFPIRS